MHWPTPWKAMHSIGSLDGFRCVGAVHIQRSCSLWSWQLTLPPRPGAVRATQIASRSDKTVSRTQTNVLETIATSRNLVYDLSTPVDLTSIPDRGLTCGMKSRQTSIDHLLPPPMARPYCCILVSHTFLDHLRHPQEAAQIQAK